MPWYFKMFAVLLIFAGEAGAIYAETLAAKYYQLSSGTFIGIFLKMFLIIMVAGGLLLSGYMLGLRAIKNIWLVSAVSISSIIIIEPLLNIMVFDHVLTRGALVGLICGVIGILATFIL